MFLAHSPQNNLVSFKQITGVPASITEEPLSQGTLKKISNIFYTFRLALAAVTWLKKFIF